MTVKGPHRQSSTQRQTAYLERLADGGGASVRIDFQGEDLAKLDALVASGDAGSRAEVVRGLVRSAYARRQRK